MSSSTRCTASSSQERVAWKTITCSTLSLRCVIPGRYADIRSSQQEVAAKRFADDLAVQARERFGEGRDLLQRVKGRLSAFSEGPLRRQLNATRGEGFVRGVDARLAGIYQWTINIDVEEEPNDLGRSRLQLKFGPSAWFANERDPSWIPNGRNRAKRTTRDYSSRGPASRKSVSRP